MKNLRLLIVLIIAATVMVSCEKKMDMDRVSNANATVKATWAVGPSTPVSALPVTPVIIDGDNKGGNRTCMEVFDHFGVVGECGIDFICGEKVDYDEGSGWASSFPDGLTVQLDGIHISFSIAGCLEINGASWQVGAVIVKGSNAANVYWYPEGATSDQGLAAPGNKHMVSNLTFCLVPCEGGEDPEKIIAVKVKDNKTNPETYAFTNAGGWYIECVPFVETSYQLYRDDNMTNPVATLSIADVVGDADLDVTIDVNDGITDFLIDEVFILLGAVGDCHQDYDDYPYVDKAIGHVDNIIINGNDL